MVPGAAEKHPIEENSSHEDNEIKISSEQSDELNEVDGDVRPKLLHPDGETGSVSVPSPVHAQTRALEQAFGETESAGAEDVLVPEEDDISSAEHSIPYALAALSEPFSTDGDEINADDRDANIEAPDTILDEGEGYGMDGDSHICQELGESLTGNAESVFERDLIATLENAPVDSADSEDADDADSSSSKAQDESIVERLSNWLSPSKVAVDAAAEIGLTAKGPDTKSAQHAEPVREEISLFAGPNGQSYADAWYALHMPETDDRPGWSTPAFTFSIAWFAYRKLYRAAMLALITLAATMVFNPAVGVVMLIAIMVCAGIYGKSLYVSHADATIRAKMTSAKNADAYLDSLKRSGGVSWVMGTASALCVFGLAMLGGLSFTV